jgi:CRP/FNR family transcriptional regulator, cyclic AMP receptor protein
MGAEETLFQKFGREFPKGTVLFREGEPGKEMFVLQSGKIAISKSVREQEKLLAILGPGEFFGEMSIIANRPRNATATVSEDAKVLVIDPKTFEGMIRGNSEIAVRMIKKLADRLSEADAQIENLLLSDPSSRVVHYLITACEHRGLSTPEGVEIEISLRDLPRELGVGEPAVRFVLEKVERASLIQRQGERVLVRDVPSLKEFLKYLEMKVKFGDL